MRLNQVCAFEARKHSCHGFARQSYHLCDLFMGKRKRMTVVLRVGSWQFQQKSSQLFLSTGGKTQIARLVKGGVVHMAQDLSDTQCCVPMLPQELQENIPRNKAA